MTVVPAVTPESPTPPMPESSSEPPVGIPVLAQAVESLRRRWPSVGTLPAVPTGDEDDGPGWDIVEEWGLQSFPASDPPSNW